MNNLLNKEIYIYVKHINLNNVIKIKCNDIYIIEVILKTFKDFEINIKQDENIKCDINIIKSNDLFKISTYKKESKLTSSIEEALWIIIREICEGLVIETEEKYYILHGCAYYNNGKSYLFLGRTGIGKSSLSYVLSKETSMKYMSDDLIGVNVRSLKACSFPKPIFLRDLAHLNIEYKEIEEMSRNKISFENDNRIFYNANNSILTYEDIVIDKIFLTTRTDNTEVVCKSINKNKAFIEIWKNMYSSENTIKKRNLALALAKEVPVYELQYSSVIEQKDKIIELMR